MTPAATQAGRKRGTTQKDRRQASIDANRGSGRRETDFAARSIMAAPKLRLTGNRGKLPDGMPPECSKPALAPEDPSSPTSTLAKDLSRIPSFTMATQPVPPQLSGQPSPRVDSGLLSERLQRAKSWKSGQRLHSAGDEGAATPSGSGEADAVASAEPSPSAVSLAAAASEEDADHAPPTTPKLRLSLSRVFGQRAPSSASVKLHSHEQQPPPPPPQQQQHQPQSQQLAV